MQADATSAAALLDDVEALRARVHRDRYPYGLWAGLIAAVAVTGAVGFLLNDQVVTRSCQVSGDGVSFCAEGSAGFNGWWVWVVAAAAAVPVSIARRHRRGMWRPTWRTLAVAVLAFYAVAPWAQQGRFVPAAVYPAAAAVALGIVAARRRDMLVVVVAGLAAALSVVLWWRIDADWFLNRNAGLALVSFGVAALAAAVTVRWRPRPGA